MQTSANLPSRSSLNLDRCPDCGGTGFVVPDLPPGHPNFGKAVPCQCRAQEQYERKLRKLNSLGALGAVAHLTFSTFISEPSHLITDRLVNMRRAFDTCLSYASNPDGWLLITGAYGCGKTHLAAAIANARLAEGYSAIFMTVPDLLDHLRAAFNPNSETAYDELFEQVRNTPLLILDDLGAQSSTPWAQEKLFQLFNHRYNAQLPTVITTNLRLDELEPRLRSRLMDAVLVTNVAITAPDFRTGKDSGWNSGDSDLSSLATHEAKRFDSFVVKRVDVSDSEQSNLREAVHACMEYVDQPVGWLVLTGRHASGKTHLAAAIANAFAERMRFDVMFVAVPDLLDYLRGAFSPQSTTSYDRRFDQVRRAPLLVLDNLALFSATPWAREKLFQLLSYRYDRNMLTVLTTSAEIKQFDPWLEARIQDVNRCRVVALTVPPYRGNRSWQGSSTGASTMRRKPT